LAGNIENHITIFSVADPGTSDSSMSPDLSYPGPHEESPPQSLGMMMSMNNSHERSWFSGLLGDEDLDGTFSHANNTVGTGYSNSSMSEMTIALPCTADRPISHLPYDVSSEEEQANSLAHFTLLHGVQYNNFAHKVAAVLDLYDSEFCVLPLTEDCRSNPFRVRRETCEDAAFLLHAVLALATQHLAKKNNSALLLAQMHHHQATAVSLFREAVAYTPAFTALDTLLLLVNFESTQTASSTWAVHIRGAYDIIETIGIETVCRRSSRTRAQIAMLIWWDITIALIARNAPRFPLTYLQTLMIYSSEDGWSWVSLNGCPADLVLAMAHLARLASIYERVLGMEWTRFDETPVQRIIDEVERWNNPDERSAHSIGQTKGDVDVHLNRFHCVEAWRRAIQLYAYRVFSRDQSDSRLDSITYLARVILDHVRCIPDTAIVQKQTLLPVFLAGAESGNEATRDFVRAYCRHWSITARFDMFDSAATLLEHVWEDWTPATRNKYWWGSKVGKDSFTSPEDDSQFFASELLLG
jgi:hypothetical protein